MSIHRVVTLLLVAGVLSACTTETYIRQSMSGYQQAAPRVQLGDSKSKALSILLPTQQEMMQERPDLSRSPDQFVKDGKTVEIYYMRSGWTSDGLTTDDEFTPYVFVDNKLVAIGWSALGGPRTTGQVVPQNNYIDNGPSFQPYQMPNMGITNCNMIGNSMWCNQF